MSGLYMRDAAPLSQEEWAALDHVIVEVAQQFLVGRQFINLVGPLGPGQELVPVGSGEKRKFLPLQLIQQDFTLMWRDIEASRASGFPLEIGPAAQAAITCVRQEDQMIFDTLLKAAEKSVALSDWDSEETPLSDVVKATELLVKDDFFGPYAVILSPSMMTKTQRVSTAAGMLVSKMIKGVAKGGIFQSPLLEKDQGLVVSLGQYNLDLVVAQDLVTAYTGNEGLDHLFTVLESLVLRIKRPGALCKLG
ncbi:MAG: family 1 encapsulin nanocompartment shell protein [Anaerolineae bacterium]|nr:family 1 encapsulin nanocompartment shell protein [Anaerolineae bacterium]